MSETTQGGVGWATEEQIRAWGAAVREEIVRGEFSPEMIAEARAALERMKAREGEDIEQWAKELAESWSGFDDPA